MSPAVASASAHGKSCSTSSSINDAVAAAPSGGTVKVCPGTYDGNVLIDKPLTLIGNGATIDATGMENGVWVVSPDVRVTGFTIENANGEGVLVGIDSFADVGMLPEAGPVISNVKIDHNQVINNNKGFNGTEESNCKYPGDCGGGIHFNVTTQSQIMDNTVTGNADGVLLTDDYGPNSYNLVSGNVVSHNAHECGITLPSHSSDAVTFDPTTFAVTGLNPSAGGVYGNTVVGNIADDNGTDQAPPQFGGGGSGAGIGLFGSGPGSAVYDNTVANNEASGNGLAGITVHAHHPGGEFMNGNSLVNNTLGTNNVLGDGFDGPPAMDFDTTGIAVFSVPAVHMTIAANRISDNAIGIWLSQTVTANGINSNKYSNVQHALVTG
jgi:parallel beta-helix repeat protein